MVLGVVPFRFGTWVCFGLGLCHGFGIGLVCFVSLFWAWFGFGKWAPSTRTDTVDKKFVHISSCFGLVELDYNPDDGCYYTLASNGQIERFQRLMNAIN